MDKYILLKIYSEEDKNKIKEQLNYVPYQIKEDLVLIRYDISNYFIKSFVLKNNLDYFILNKDVLLNILKIDCITDVYIKINNGYCDINLINSLNADIEHISFRINNKLIIIYSNGIITTNCTFETIKHIFDKIIYTL